MKVLFFATARSLAGCASDDFPLAGPATSADVWRALVAKYPALAPLRTVARLSRNDEYAGDDARFSDRDIVGVIPPVSGG